MPHVSIPVHRVSIHVFGKVQGVWFRASVKSKAESLGIVGFVRNMPDGSVYLEAMGSVEQVRDLVAWCHHGPELARVDRIVTLEISTTEWPERFEIRRG